MSFVDTGFFKDTSTISSPNSCFELDILYGEIAYQDSFRDISLIIKIQRLFRRKYYIRKYEESRRDDKKFKVALVQIDQSIYSEVKEVLAQWKIFDNEILDLTSSSSASSSSASSSSTRSSHARSNFGNTIIKSHLFIVDLMIHRLENGYSHSIQVIRANDDTIEAIAFLL